MLMVINASRRHWQTINEYIDGIVRHCEVTRVCFQEQSTQDQKYYSDDTVLVRTTDMDMETAMLICHRIPLSLTVLLFNDLVGNPHEPITVERPLLDESGLEIDIPTADDV